MPRRRRTPPRPPERPPHPVVPMVGVQIGLTLFVVPAVAYPFSSRDLVALWELVPRLERRKPANDAPRPRARPALPPKRSQ